MRSDLLGERETIIVRPTVLEMIRRQLGSSRIEVSLLGLGCNSLGHIPPEEAARLVTAALDCGVTFFDTANVYAQGRSEQELGRLVPRGHDDLVIATKVGHPSSVSSGGAPCAPDQVVAAVDASLGRLRRDAIDVLLLHFPDPNTPIVETLLALSSLLQQGKIRSYGVSNFSTSQLDELLQAAGASGLVRPVLVQDEYSLLRRAVETTLIPQVLAYGLGFVPFFPLASGLLTGTYRNGRTPNIALRTKIVRRFEERFFLESHWRALEALHEYSDRTAIPLHQLALHWLAARPAVTTVIAGASAAAQVLANAQALATPVAAAALRAVDQVLANLTRACPTEEGGLPAS